MFIVKATETAFAYFLANVGTLPEGLHIYTGQDDEDMEAPCVVCSGNDASANEDFIGSGIWHVPISIKIKEIIPDTATTSSLAGTVFQAICTRTIKEDLTNSLSNYAVLDVTPLDTSMTVEGEAWEQTLQFEVVCSLSRS